MSVRIPSSIAPARGANENASRTLLVGYGLMNLVADRGVAVAVARFSIERVGVVLGAGSPSGRTNSGPWLVESLRKDKRVKALKDQCALPTLDGSFTEVTPELLERRVAGALNMAGTSRVSGIEFLAAYTDTLGLGLSLVESFRVNDVLWLAKRRKDSSLDVSTVASILGEKPLFLSNMMFKLKRATTDSGA